MRLWYYGIWIRVFFVAHPGPIMKAARGIEAAGDSVVTKTINLVPIMCLPSDKESAIHPNKIVHQKDDVRI